MTIVLQLLLALLPYILPLILKRKQRDGILNKLRRRIRERRERRRFGSWLYKFSQEIANDPDRGADEGFQRRNGLPED